MDTEQEKQVKALFLAMFARFRPDIVMKWSYFLATRYPRLRRYYFNLRYPLNKERRAWREQELLRHTYVNLDFSYGLAQYQAIESQQRLAQFAQHIKETPNE